MQKRNLTAMTLVTAVTLFGCPKPEEKKAPPPPEKAASKAASQPAEAKKAEEAPAHYMNPKENLNADPNYVPGDYPSPDTAAAVKAYQERAKAVAMTGKVLKVQPGGELTFGIAKNEKKRVFGYFRKYEGAVQLGEGGPTKVELVIDVNSIDTAVKGRDFRIMSILLESMKPELGTAVLTFDTFDMGGKSWADAVKEGAPITATGTLKVNGKANPATAKLTVKQEKDVYTVETSEPLNIKLSDYGYGQRPYALMKECNHKSMGNVVDLGVALKLK